MNLSLKVISVITNFKKTFKIQRLEKYSTGQVAYRRIRNYTSAIISECR